MSNSMFFFHSLILKRIIKLTLIHKYFYRTNRMKAVIHSLFKFNFVFNTT